MVPAAWRGELLPILVAFRAEPSSRVRPTLGAFGGAIARALERDLARRSSRPRPSARRHRRRDDSRRRRPVARRPRLYRGLMERVPEKSGRRQSFSGRGAALRCDGRHARLLHAIGVGHTSAWPSVMSPGGRDGVSHRRRRRLRQLLLRLLECRRTATRRTGDGGRLAERGVWPSSGPDSSDRSRIPDDSVAGRRCAPPRPPVYFVHGPPPPPRTRPASRARAAAVPTATTTVTGTTGTGTTGTGRRALARAPLARGPLARRHRPL